MQRLADQVELQVFQVAQAAVNELRVFAAGAGGKMLLLNQSDSQRRACMRCPQRQIASHARAIDPATNHQDVHAAGFQLLDLTTAHVRHLRLTEPRP
jgi:hypothetical protein